MSEGQEDKLGIGVCVALILIGLVAPDWFGIDLAPLGLVIAAIGTPIAFIGWYRSRKNEDAGGVSAVVGGLMMIGAVVMMVIGLFTGGCSMLTSNSSHDKGDSVEFGINLLTPGTSEHDWYEKEYLDKK